MYPIPRYNITTPPVNPAVSTADIKTHLRITGTDEDGYLDSLVSVATAYAQNFQNRQYITATYQMFLDDFPLCEIRVPRPPLQSVSSIQYYDATGTQQTLSTSIYEVDNNGPVGRIVRADDQTWPEVDDRLNAVTITYTAGYGDDASDIPSETIHAIKLMVGHWYLHRENTQDIKPQSIPAGAEALLSFNELRSEVAGV